MNLCILMFSFLFQFFLIEIYLVEARVVFTGFLFVSFCVKFKSIGACFCVHQLSVLFVGHLSRCVSV